MVFSKKEKPLSEVQDEIERTDAELTLAQKKTLLAELRKRNVSLQDFGSWKAAWNWLKTH